jgi:uncharacterized protein (UPF0264 family)
MSGLLVSVRDADEADAALAGGADVIDVKDPSQGPLGPASTSVIAAVERRVAGRRPVTAALGELRETVRWWPQADGLAFLKWGLARTGRENWRLMLNDAACWLDRCQPGAGMVITAYADWQAADAPPPEEVCAFARRPGSDFPWAARSTGAFLLDTFTKAPGPDGRRPTLLDFLPVRKAVLLCKLCRAVGVRVALAGSLGAAEIERLLPAAPDWFAVRGAACAGGDRGGRIDEGRVRGLAALAARAPSP